jgi:hypothetical protein
MGLVIGLASDFRIIDNKKYNHLARGAFMGLVISTAFFLSTGFRDFLSYPAGILYGLIIDYVATKYT